VLYLAPDAGEADAAHARIAGRADECIDRDMLFLDLGQNGVVKGPLYGELTPAQRTLLREQYDLSTTNAIFILVGKDGGEKARQRGRLDLQAFFDLIDTMPMRLREMEHKNK
jgi:hypothetical protein